MNLILNLRPKKGMFSFTGLKMPDIPPHSPVYFLKSRWVNRIICLSLLSFHFHLKFSSAEGKVLTFINHSIVFPATQLCKNALQSPTSSSPITSRFSFWYKKPIEFSKCQSVLAAFCADFFYFFCLTALVLWQLGVCGDELEPQWTCSCSKR